MGFGPDQLLYGSSVLPLHFLKVNSAKKGIDDLGILGGGEVYSFLAHDQKLLMATYSAIAPLMSYSAR